MDKKDFHASTLEAIDALLDAKASSHCHQVAIDVLLSTANMATTAADAYEKLKELRAAEQEQAALARSLLNALVPDDLDALVPDALVPDALVPNQDEETL